MHDCVKCSWNGRRTGLRTKGFNLLLCLYTSSTPAVMKLISRPSYYKSCGQTIRRVLPKQGDDTFDVPQKWHSTLRVGTLRPVHTRGNIPESKSFFLREQICLGNHHGAGLNFISVIYKFHRTGVVSRWNPHSNAPQEVSRHS